MAHHLSTMGKLALVLAVALLADHAASLALPKLVYGFFPLWCWLLPTGYVMDPQGAVAEPVPPEARETRLCKARLGPRLFPPAL